MTAGAPFATQLDVDIRAEGARRTLPAVPLDDPHRLGSGRQSARDPMPGPKVAAGEVQPSYGPARAGAVL